MRVLRPIAVLLFGTVAVAAQTLPQTPQGSTSTDPAAQVCPKDGKERLFLSAHCAKKGSTDSRESSDFRLAEPFAQPAADLKALQTRQISFDGDAALTPAPDSVNLQLPEPAVEAPQAPSLVQPPPVRTPASSKAVDAAFWSTWGLYHATFISDFTTTTICIHKGGYETDPLYTRFGNRNVVGVVGSATVLHLAASAVTLALHKWANGKTGWKKWLLDGSAIGIDTYGIGAHTYGTVNNIEVIQTQH